MQLEQLFVVVSIAALLGMPAARATNEFSKPAESAPADSADSADPSQWRRVALSRALAAAGAVDDPYRRAEAFAGIARAQMFVEDSSAADRTIHQALSAAGQISEPAFRGWVLHDIVLAQIAAEDLHGARVTAGRIEAERPQGAAFAVIAGLQLRGGDLAAAQATAKKIRDPGAKSGVLRQIVAVQSTRGELDAARETLRGIEDKFYLTLALGDVAVAEVRGGNIDRANALAARARRSSRAQVYGRIAMARVETSGAHGAAETLPKIDDEQYRALVQSRIAAARAAAGDADGAQQLFASAIATADGVANKPPRRAMTLSQIARMQAASGEGVASGETLRRARLEAARLPPGVEREETLDYIARGQARAGDSAGALDTAMQMNDRVARALLVRDVVTLQTDATSASASASAASFDDPLIETAAQFGVLGMQLLRSGQPMSVDTIDAARLAVRKIDDAQLKPAAFSALAAARVRTGDAEGGSSIFQEALEAADSISRNDQRAAAYVRIVNALNDRLVFLGQPVNSDVAKGDQTEIR